MGGFYSGNSCKCPYNKESLNLSIIFFLTIEHNIVMFHINVNKDKTLSNIVLLKLLISRNGGLYDFN